MFTTLLRRWCAIPGFSVRRFPLALLASLLALVAAVVLHRDDWGLSDAWNGVLLRIVLLWPFALFGNVAWVMYRERDKRPVRRGLAVGAVLLVVAFWMLPSQPQQEAAGFWFRYFLLGAVLLVATAGVPARRTGHPDLWDSVWPIGLAAFMATLSAMLVVGGVCLALVSVDKLFTINLSEDLYIDTFFTGFFLLAPITAFAWLPSPLGQRQPQPAWLKAATRIVLIPLCLLYALILFAYLGKIALAAEWPDGWVAMPTLIFGALGLIAYFIARPARDRDAETWATRFCRVFPWVLLPLAVILILAMRVRVAAYGFTEWRVIGLAAGLWFLAFSLVYAVRPRLSPWWIAVSLGLCGVLLGVGPLSAPRLSLHSQRDRLDTLLTAAGVREGDPVTIAGDEANRIRSGLEYLLEHHGEDGLPPWVLERWLAQQDDDKPVSVAGRNRRGRRHFAQQLLRALEVTLVGDTQHRWYRIRCEMASMELGDFHDLTVGVVGQDDPLPFRIDQQMRVSTGEGRIAVEELDAFQSALLDALKHHSPGTVLLPVELMTLEFSHADEDYVVIFLNLVVSDRRRADTEPTLRNYGGTYLVFRRTPVRENLNSLQME